MQSKAASEAAMTLIAARREGRKLTALPAAVRPLNLDDAYAVQAAFRKHWGESAGGWKIGATAEPVQVRFGVKEPFFGPFFPATTHVSPATLAASSLQHAALETEFAFRFRKALPPRTSRYPRAEVLAAIDALIPAFEIVSPRYDRIPFDSPFEAIADCGLNGAMVLGAARTDGWQALDLATHSVKLFVDGAAAAEGTGALVLGHPFNVLEWAVNALSARGIGIEAGHVVSTGTLTGVVPLKAGQTAVGDFGALGRVELRIT